MTNLKKIILKCLIVLAFLVLALFGSAQETFADDIREQKLAAYLGKHNSPLAYYAKEFIIQADENGFDYRLLPAIAGVESTFCKRYIVGTYNCWGWGVGKIPFESWGHGINKISDSLGEKYIGRGAKTVEQIGKIYCPPTHESWSRNVRFFMNEIDQVDLTNWPEARPTDQAAAPSLSI